MHLELNDAETDVERGLVQGAGRVERRDNLLARILRGTVAARVHTVGGYAHVDNFLCARATSTLPYCVLEANNVNEYG